MSPMRAGRPCSYPGCTAIVYDGARCGMHVRTGQEQGYRRWYLTPEWKRIREMQLLRYPWCVECKKNGQLVQATDVDHVIPHRGDRRLFFEGELQSLCHACHSRKTIGEVIA